MASVSFNQLRAKLAQFLDEVCDSRTPLRVTRRKGRSVVLMSVDEYDRLIETLHLLHSPANAARLLASIEEADKDLLVERELTGGLSAGEK
jgi:antitoxin YefM